MFCVAFGSLAGTAAGLLVSGLLGSESSTNQNQDDGSGGGSAATIAKQPQHRPWSSRIVDAAENLAQRLQPPPPPSAAAPPAAAAAAAAPSTAPPSTGIGAAAGGTRHAPSETIAFGPTTAPAAEATLPQPTPRLYEVEAPPPSSPAHAVAAAAGMPPRRTHGFDPLAVEYDIPAGGAAADLRNLQVTVEGQQVLPASLSGGAAAAAGIERLRAGAAAGVASAGAAAGIAAGLVEDVLCARGQRELLDLAPSWIGAPDFEKASALNQLLKLLWPQLAAAAEAAVREQVAAAAARVAAGGVPGLAELTLRRCTAGPAAPPQIGGVKATGGWAPPGGGGGAGGVTTAAAAAGGGSGGAVEELVVEFDIAWASELELELGVSFGFPGRSTVRHGGGGGGGGFLRRLPRLVLPPVLLSLSRLHLRASVRLVLGPLLPEPPYLAAVGVTLLHPPLLDASLGVGLDLWGGLTWQRRRRRRPPPPPAAAAAEAEGAEAAAKSTADGGEARDETTGASYSVHADADAGTGGDGRRTGDGGYGGGWTLDVLAVPVLGWALRGGVQRTMLYPRHVVVHLAGVEAEGGGGVRQLPPPGLLRLRLRRVEGLEAAAAAAERLDVYVMAQVRGGAVQRSPTRSGTNSFSWEQPSNDMRATAAATGRPTGDGSSSTLGGGGGDGGADGGYMLEMLVSDPSRQTLLLQVLRDREGWPSYDLAGGSGSGASGAAAAAVYGREGEGEGELYDDALHIGDEQAAAGLVVLEVSYIPLRHEDVSAPAVGGRKAAAAATSSEAAAVAAAAAAAAADLERQRRELSDAAATISGEVAGLIDPRVAITKAAAAATGASGGGGGAPAGLATGIPVRVEFGALWSGEFARAVRQSVGAEEKAVLTVRVMRLKMLAGGGNTGTAAGVDPFVELILLDSSGRVEAVRRTPVRYNSGPVAVWAEDPPLQFFGAVAGGELVVRSWDKTSRGWEALGKALTLVAQPRADELLGEVRLPLMAVAAAGRLQRRWLLQPAGSRTLLGAAEVELQLQWLPMPSGTTTTTTTTTTTAQHS
ncbi:hypothetical protein VOLCADRAFT_98697 [Volvox carteri f. nagariensis]|uniref:C2 domain-containing protein n=1 Tax=Volvox carteri f. nagariensis TaxID=3068 RepID=D8UG17_VOLCA|nr:uncharacterized protein VOLCADRAFT_98697 [Volvox carteri f. nagariensis]EFJ41374.1 hypothetical protein VOLCADRAFT_98697 [Volvox carteri f. nagariensis]|eukprot:XP_002957604.1 hypothetical protein VOLCADRAFT_98697 [Volvox carteri f. nagariensis]